MTDIVAMLAEMPPDEVLETIEYLEKIFEDHPPFANMVHDSVHKMGWDCKNALTVAVVAAGGFAAVFQERATVLDRSTGRKMGELYAGVLQELQQGNLPTGFHRVVDTILVTEYEEEVWGSSPS